MGRKVELTREVEAGVEALWNVMSKDRLKLLGKGPSPLLEEAKVLEGDGGLGTISYLKPGPAVSHIPPIKDKVVEFDDKEHVFSIQEIEGGYLDLGFSSVVLTFKLEGKEGGKTVVRSTINTEFNEWFDGDALVDELAKFVEIFINSAHSALQESTVA
ncbi:hypothetical protein HPP92_001817 [Vanilla planifolia]|uniref:Bet v I/Major latex protein domain-containing protein n=1 Tax=Vanilla planifolia TaxID=51239 RepID=A0A835VFP7_VANPL|nr:hypothetical protein HPP92_001812 [Vanilla planifolia]KAG0497122.1 hypothetical protein HPP92_001813 [Vanilla planifolia]KAG0497123.1 hypothetical protein HPP92_001814 [Vanilla planifolia]KAG0497124.1 hypothetical protein HPP92_001815 [Vanilla planifolia]KAG0497125.1 hypothetical protein HPP92_001816 [Vanilla planifolia]